MATYRGFGSASPMGDLDNLSIDDLGLFSSIRQTPERMFLRHRGGCLRFLNGRTDLASGFGAGCQESRQGKEPPTHISPSAVQLRSPSVNAPETRPSKMTSNSVLNT